MDFEPYTVTMSNILCPNNNIIAKMQCQYDNQEQVQDQPFEWFNHRAVTCWYSTIRIALGVKFVTELPRLRINALYKFLIPFLLDSDLTERWCSNSGCSDDSNRERERERDNGTSISPRLNHTPTHTHTPSLHTHTHTYTHTHTSNPNALSTYIQYHSAQGQ